MNLNKKLFLSILCFAILFQAKAQPNTVSNANQTSQSYKPYVIMISFDGFRHDYLNRGITPNFDLIRNSGAQASSLRPSFPSKTFPNHLSLITGMYPQNHGIINNNINNPYTKKSYSLMDTIAVREPEWYQGEAFWETAKRNGILTASYFWPGSELTDENRRPTYFEKYDHHRPSEKVITGVKKWLALPEEERPHFITMYFHEVDDAGHKYGPDSKEVN
ncbi:MAG: ectonucleotide pyrophosphatase/phosphodiesterase, partial [Sphingobacteriaceae bacterium]|nr:ectonucleotide pyrophosphatase/phosphodiesterase [Sphingobacteriaceae bacterium]